MSSRLPAHVTVSAKLLGDVLQSMSVWRHGFKHPVAISARLYGGMLHGMPA